MQNTIYHSLCRRISSVLYTMCTKIWRPHYVTSQIYTHAQKKFDASALKKKIWRPHYVTSQKKFWHPRFVTLQRKHLQPHFMTLQPNIHTHTVCHYKRNCDTHTLWLYHRNSDTDTLWLYIQIPYYELLFSKKKWRKWKWFRTSTIGDFHKETLSMGWLRLVGSSKL